MTEFITTLGICTLIAIPTLVLATVIAHLVPAGLFLLVYLSVLGVSQGGAVYILSKIPKEGVK